MSIAMLACSTIPKAEDIKLPKLVSYKLDGYRCLVKSGRAVSRNNKPIANEYIRGLLSRPELDGFDGELMVPGGFNSVQSQVGSYSGRPDFVYHVFDDFSYPEMKFSYRQRRVEERIRQLKNFPAKVKLVPQWLVSTAAQVSELYKEAVDSGYEGLILRDPESPYKFGRSTLKQGWMLKLKPELDMEVTIVGFEELMHNGDTSCKKLENLSPGNMLGAFVCELTDGNTFRVGSGFTEQQRRDYWDQQARLFGATITVKYQELTQYGIPRFPVFLGFRHDY